MATRFDIIGIGNAIVDVVARVDEAFLSRHDMRKGSMTLVDAADAERLYAAMPTGEESSGGSAANTCAVAAALGDADTQPQHVLNPPVHADLAACVGLPQPSHVAGQEQAQHAGGAQGDRHHGSRGEIERLPVPEGEPHRQRLVAEAPL